MVAGGCACCCRCCRCAAENDEDDEEDEEEAGAAGRGCGGGEGAGAGGGARGVARWVDVNENLESPAAAHDAGVTTCALLCAVVAVEVAAEEEEEEEEAAIDAEADDEVFAPERPFEVEALPVVESLISERCFLSALPAPPANDVVGAPLSLRCSFSSLALEVPRPRLR